MSNILRLRGMPFQQRDYKRISSITGYLAGQRHRIQADSIDDYAEYRSRGFLGINPREASPGDGWLCLLRTDNEGNWINSEINTQNTIPESDVSNWRGVREFYQYEGKLGFWVQYDQVDISDDASGWMTIKAANAETHFAWQRINDTIVQSNIFADGSFDWLVWGGVGLTNSPWKWGKISDPDTLATSTEVTIDSSRDYVPSMTLFNGVVVFTLNETSTATIKFVPFYRTIQTITDITSANDDVGWLPENDLEFYRGDGQNAFPVAESDPDGNYMLVRITGSQSRYVDDGRYCVLKSGSPITNGGMRKLPGNFTWCYYGRAVYWNGYFLVPAWDRINGANALFAIDCGVNSPSELGACYVYQYLPDAQTVYSARNTDAIVLPVRFKREGIENVTLLQCQDDGESGYDLWLHLHERVQADFFTQLVEDDVSLEYHPTRVSPIWNGPYWAQLDENNSSDNQSPVVNEITVTGNQVSAAASASVPGWIKTDAFALPGRKFILTFEIDSIGASDAIAVGIATESATAPTDTGAYMWRSNGGFYENGTLPSPISSHTFTTSDIVSVLVDLRRGKVEFLSDAAGYQPVFVLDSRGPIGGDRYQNWIDASAVTTVGAITSDTVLKTMPAPFWNSSTGEYLFVGTSANYAFGTGDFMVDGWAYADSAAAGGIFHIHAQGSPEATSWPGTNDGIGLEWIDNTTIRIIHSGSPNSTDVTATVTQDQRFYFCLMRRSGQLRLVIDDTAVYTGAFSTNLTENSFHIGGVRSDGNGWRGYLEGIRVFKGAAVRWDEFEFTNEAPLLREIGDEGIISIAAAHMAAGTKFRPLIWLNNGSGTKTVTLHENDTFALDWTRPGYEPALAQNQNNFPQYWVEQTTFSTKTTTLTRPKKDFKAITSNQATMSIVCDFVLSGSGYVEIGPLSEATGVQQFMYGICNASHSLQQYPGQSANSYSWYLLNGHILTNGGADESPAKIITPAPQGTSYVTIAWDMDKTVSPWRLRVWFGTYRVSTSGAKHEASMISPTPSKLIGSPQSYSYAPDLLEPNIDIDPGGVDWYLCIGKSDTTNFGNNTTGQGVNFLNFGQHPFKAPKPTGFGMGFASRLKNIVPHT